MERSAVKEVVLHKDVFGSLSGNDHGDDKVSDVIEWLQGVLADVPDEYRGEVRIEVDSIGGYEGEHHTEVEIYYMRPETYQEMNRRVAEWKQQAADEVQRAQRYADEALRRLKSLG
jgi:hypothetical protein